MANPPHPAELKHRRWQFSLRTLLLFVLSLGVVVGWLANQSRLVREQQEAVSALQRLRYLVQYDYEVDSLGQPTRHNGPRAPAWARRLLGDACFVEVIRVVPSDFYLPPSDDVLVHYRGLPGLRYIDVSGEQVADRGLQHLANLTRLRTLELAGTSITDAGLVDLRRLGELRSLSLLGTRVTDDGLAQLRHLSRLQQLNLAQTDITGRGLAQLHGLVQLEQLDLAGTPGTVLHYFGLYGWYTARTQTSSPSSSRSATT